MAKLVKSLLQSVLLIIGVTFLSFLLIYFSPGDPAEIMLSKSGVAVTEEVIQAKREELGLNDPFIVQYKNWLADFVKGDMGISYKSNLPVADEFKPAVLNTLFLTVFSLVITVIVSVAFGVICAYKKDKILDKAVGAFTYVFASIPAFFLALILMYVFSVKLNLFPVMASADLKGIILPAFTLSFSLCPWYIRQVRAIILKEFDKDYVLGLRSRGISEAKILFCHIFKNAYSSLGTLFGLAVGSMLGGSAIVESIFSYNGIGKLAVEAVSARDYPVIQAFVVWMAIVFIVVNFALDVSYSIVDPRIRKGVEK